MKLNKQDILKSLETISAPGEGQNMVESGAVTNVVTFADEVVVDIKLQTQAYKPKRKPKLRSCKPFTNWCMKKLKLRSM